MFTKVEGVGPAVATRLCQELEIMIIAILDLFSG